MGGFNDVVQPHLIGRNLRAANHVLDEIDVDSLKEVENVAKLQGKQLKLFAHPLADRTQHRPRTTINLERVFQYTPQGSETRKFLGMELKPRTYYVLTGKDNAGQKAMVLTHLPRRALFRKGPQILAMKVGGQTSIRFKGDLLSDWRNRRTHLAEQFQNLTNPHFDGKEAGLGNTLALNYLGQINTNDSRLGVFPGSRRQAYGNVGNLFSQVETRLRESDS